MLRELTMDKPNGRGRNLRHWFALLFAVVMSFAVAGCAKQAPLTPGMAVTVPDEALGQGYVASDITAGEARLRANDVISISVFREPDLSSDNLIITAGGLVSLPLVGEVQAAGLTPAQLEAQLEQMLGSRYLRNPDVSVNVAAYASHLVTVEGQVEAPGVYQFQPGARLSSGIALASGTTRVAQTSEVAVFRQTDEGIAIAKFDYTQVRAGLMLDPVLQPGDRIVVGTDNLSQFWQDALKALPVFALFTRF